LQFAVASGATVIAISSSDEKLKIATKLGAKYVINYKTTPKWDEEVLKVTNDVGVDRVIEVRTMCLRMTPVDAEFQPWQVVGNAALAKSIASLRPGGSIDIIGGVGGFVSIRAVYRDRSRTAYPTNQPFCRAMSRQSI
jgi:NADPH:quinone reductase-like Zn-dependent oxidoreductase